MEGEGFEKRNWKYEVKVNYNGVWRKCFECEKRKKVKL